MNFYIILVLLISSCAQLPESQRMLDKRADYDDLNYTQLNVQSLTSRNKSKVALVWSFREDLPNGIYFWGAWFSLVVEDDSWAFENNKKR